jgi:proteasome lid subunit RPN8/RPN11
MADHRLLIATHLLEQMRAAAKDAAPNECCGLLVGRRAPVAIVTRAVAAENVHDKPAKFFTIDPALQFKLIKELRDNPGEEQLLGCYHSHPDGPAAPSPRDLAEANDPDLIWMVLDARTGEAGAFQLAAGRFEPMILIANPIPR